MKYLKLFTSHSDYNTAKSSLDKPNVSLCATENEVHYNPWADSKLVCKYNVTSISSPTQLRTNYEPNIFQSMEIDGVQLDNLVTEYTFNSTGVHTVKYELYDETKLGNNAPVFYNITSLISVSIPNSVTSIGYATFQGCSGLTRLTIPSGVTSIGQGAFGGCGGLVSITVDSNNSKYDSRNNCNAIIETATNALIVGCKNTVIPNTVTSIGQDAFSNCSGLTSVTIPDSVTSIGSTAFYQCSSLTSVTIPDSVTSIGERVFGGCTSLANITVGNNNSAYDSRNNCNAIIKTNTNTLVVGCKNTVIPNTVTSIGDSAFQEHNLTGALTIPNSVTSIGRQSFSNCSGLTSVNIPSGVTSIDSFAFSYCTSLTNITSLATTAPTIKISTFNGVGTGGTLTVPIGSSGYDVWMGTGDYYLGKYGWTKVEQ